MTVTSNKETMNFQTEVKQLLHLMVHSLYSNKEIFLRELISNAADAADKLRFAALENDALYESDPNLKIRITPNKDAGTLTISDNGIGMNREDVIANLGTIARSGTAEFLAKLSGDQKKDSQLIGQFGVGFYSGFIVADKITVESRKAGEEADTGVRWVSEGDGEFAVESIEKSARGTDIILHLKETEKEFLEDFRLRSVIGKYSDHIALPVEMEKMVPPVSEEDADDKPADVAPEYEVINKATALWSRDKSDISDEEYQEFYKHLSHDFNDALTWSHNRVEGKHEYTSLLYIPAKAPFDLWNRDRVRGVKLYVQRVFIMDDAEQFLPVYLRFVRGILDSNDLPLNVSREILQDSATTQSLRNATVKRVLGMLEKQAKKDPESYQAFWNEFGQVLKEGVAEDFANKEQIAGLLRFASTHNDSEEQSVSLADYIERMKPDQEKIYYVAAESFLTAKNSPHIEVLRKKGIEVLLLSDRIDEWMVGYLQEFDGKPLQSVTQGELDLGKLEDETEKQAREKAADEHKALVERVSEVLGDRVDEVRVTLRLTDSPACIVSKADGMSAQMERIMKSAGQEVPASKPIFELNPEHSLITRLDSESDEARFADLVEILFDQASLAESGQLDNPAVFVKRLNKLILELGS